MSGNVGKMNDPDASLFIQVSEITGSTQRGAIVDLIKDLKSNGIWSKMKAIYPFVGGTDTSHKWNLKDPRDLDAAYRLTFFGGWTHSSNGALPNGSNGYANTYIIPSTTLTNNSTHLSFYSRTDNSQGSAEIISTRYSGTINGVTSSGVWLMHIKWPDPNTFYTDHYNTGTQRISATNTNSTGFYVSSRTTSTSLKAYKNGTQLGTTNTNTSADFSSLNIGVTISGETFYNTLYSSKQVAFATIGDGLTDSEVSTLYTIVQKYQTTLGRQV
jgi:hypothetical protein